MAIFEKKDAQKVRKRRFLGSWQKSYSFRYGFLLQYESANGIFFAKTVCLRKHWFLSYDSKSLRAMRMQDSLNYNITQTC